MPLRIRTRPYTREGLLGLMATTRNVSLAAECPIGQVTGDAQIKKFYVQKERFEGISVENDRTQNLATGKGERFSNSK